MNAVLCNYNSRQLIYNKHLTVNTQRIFTYQFNLTELIIKTIYNAMRYPLI